MMQRGLVWGWMGLGLVAAVACGGTSSQDVGSGGGASATGGSAAGRAGGAGDGGSVAGGSSGSGASGGAAGSGAVGGTAGSSGVGATGGSSTGGAAGQGAECETATDCTLFADCCSCLALAPNEDAAACAADCIQSHCAAIGVELGDIACVAGRCVLDRSCDTSSVTCERLPPDCSAGQVPIAEDSCYGACIPAQECTRVEACSDCDGAGLECVQYEALQPTTHCVDPQPLCEGETQCQCMGVCSRPFQCAGSSGDPLRCTCPTC